MSEEAKPELIAESESGVDRGRKPRRSSPGKKLGLLVGTGLLILLALEVILRLYYASPMDPRRVFNPGGNHPRYLTMEDDRLGYRLRPYFRGRVISHKDDFNTGVVINSLGLRDQHDPQSTAAGFRILAAGDSYTFGEGVEQDETYCADLERESSKVLLRKVECINQGVPGYSLQQAGGLLERMLPVYHPNLVMVLWTTLTLPRESPPYPMRYAKGFIFFPNSESFFQPKNGKLRLIEFESPWARWIDQWGQSHSFVYSCAKFKVFYTYIGWTMTARPLVSRTAEQFGPAIAHLRDIKRTCDDKGADFLLVAVCFSPAEREVLEDLCRKNGIKVLALDLVSSLKDNGMDYDDFHFPHDYHPNPRGHEFLARKIMQYLLEHRP